MEKIVLGHDGLKWPETMDAMVWAEMFCEKNPGTDCGLMLAWFANAIMVGYDTAMRRVEKDAQSK